MLPKCPRCQADLELEYDPTWELTSYFPGKPSSYGARLRHTAYIYCNNDDCGYMIDGVLENPELGPDGRTFIAGHFVEVPKKEN